jgi:hypothetical protein
MLLHVIRIQTNLIHSVGSTKSKKKKGKGSSVPTAPSPAGVQESQEIALYDFQK